MSEASSIDEYIERNFKHNFIVNFLDGTFFWLGASFLATRTILPLYVSHYTESKLIIGLIPMIANGGWLLPQLFTANWVQRLPRKLVVPVKLGFFTERVPVILMAPATLWLTNRNPNLALIAFLLLFSWFTVGAGVTAVGWQDMMAKIFPTNRRGRFFGITNFSGTAIGIGGAAVASQLLDKYDFPQGYALCFAIAGAFILLSWFFLALTREPDQVSEKPIISQKEFWRQLPGLIRTDHNFAKYLISQIVISLSGMAGGFVAVYAVQKWSLSDSKAGTFTASMLIGQALANLIFGQLADRKGHKLVLEISVMLAVIAVGMASIAQTPEWFYLIFSLSGASLAGFILSGIMIAFEFGPPDARATYIGLNNTISGVAASIAPMLGGWFAELFGYQGLFVIAFMIGLAGFSLLRWWVQEPRKIV